MDLRIEKTKRNIINAFLQLRSKKPLEKITVKELSQLAEINKATFYLHYHDIYDLSETLEAEAVQSTLHSIEHADMIFSNIELFVQELSEAFISNEQLIRILFEGNRSIRFVNIFEEELKKLIAIVNPDYFKSPEINMALTYMIYGAYYTYYKFRENGINSVFNIIGKLCAEIVKLYPQ